jgi:hypothetical protein
MGLIRATRKRITRSMDLIRAMIKGIAIGQKLKMMEEMINLLHKKGNVEKVLAWKIMMPNVLSAMGTHIWKRVL